MVASANPAPIFRCPASLGLSGRDDAAFEFSGACALSLEACRFPPDELRTYTIRKHCESSIQLQCELLFGSNGAASIGSGPRSRSRSRALNLAVQLARVAEWKTSTRLIRVLGSFPLKQPRATESVSELGDHQSKSASARQTGFGTRHAANVLLVEMLGSCGRFRVAASVRSSFAIALANRVKQDKIITGVQASSSRGPIRVQSRPPMAGSAATLLLRLFSAPMELIGPTMIWLDLDELSRPLWTASCRLVNRAKTNSGNYFTSFASVCLVANLSRSLVTSSDRPYRDG